LNEVALANLGFLDVTAASGIALADGIAYVIADDVAALGCYSLDARRAGSIPLFAGDAPLPADYAARKPLKRDLEALVALPEGSLLALGSGSKSNRRRGALIHLGSQSVSEIDADGLYGALDHEFARLNIEGAVMWRDRLLLAQRGNGRDDAVVSLDLDGAMRDLANGVLSRHSLRSIVRAELGTLDGVPLGLTDLAAHPSRGVFFVGAAEATDDPVADAECAGSVLGRFDQDFGVGSVARLRPDLKIEGLAYWKFVDGQDCWLAVADADAPERPSPLMSAYTAPAF
jgi:hypothetical protein